MSLDNQLTWVVNTDTNTCRIYLYNREHVQLILLKEIQHLENKLKNIDLISDRPGHYKSDGSSHGAYSQSSNPKEIKIDKFSKEIAKVLNHGRNNQLFKSLIIIAAPHMSGLIFNYMDKHVKKLVTHKIEKDLINLPEHELLDLLKYHTKYVNKS